MAERYQGDGATANGFDRHCLTVEEFMALYEEGYRAPPNMRCPDTWRMSVSSISILPKPHDVAKSAVIHRHFYEVLTPEQRADPLWDP
jgi:hypothetical protein